MAWTDERKEMVKRLWADGFSASQIAGELGVTRNAVIGIVHRMGLPKRRDMFAPVARRVPSPRRAPKRSPRPVFWFEPIPDEPMPPEALPPVEPPLSLLKLTTATCRWPVGDPQSPDFRFCGHAPASGLPYCAYHARIAYQPKTQRKQQSDKRYADFLARRVTA